ncbi:MAG: murein hydrolase activator EnvC family protein [Acidimicrobiales bacterium]
MAPTYTRHPARPARPARRLVAALVAVVVGAVLVPTTTSGAEPTIAEELASAREEATATAEELSAIETDLARLESDIADHDEEIEAVRSELAALEDEVAEIAVQRYMSAGNGPIAYSDDLHEHQRIDVMMSAVQLESETTMAAYEDANGRLEAASDALADRLDDQAAARERLTDRLEELNDQLGELSELQRQAEAEAARLEAERRQAAAEAAAETTTTAAPTTTATTTTTTTTAAADTASSPSSSSTTTTAPTTTTTAPTTTTTEASSADEITTEPDGDGGSASGFLCPVRGASVFTDSWGAPRSGGRTHKGVDMLAEIGTPAVAPVSGTVTHRGNSIGGLSYHLDGDDGNYYYGTHLSEYGAEGRVSAGTVIGYVGDSGNAAGIPHLHFEIHPGGRGNAINPYPTVKAACG